jgi:hypothetical protein
VEAASLLQHPYGRVIGLQLPGIVQCREALGLPDRFAGAAPHDDWDVITTTLANMRQIQFALKYNF